MSLDKNKPFSGMPEGLKFRNIVKNVGIPLLLTLTLSFASEKHSCAQKYDFISDQLVNPNDIGAKNYLTAQYNFFRKTNQTLTPNLSYDLGALTAELNTWSFLDPFLNEPLPVDVSKVASSLLENKVPEKTGVSFPFLRDHGIFLITIPRLERELRKLQDSANITFTKTSTFIRNVYLHDVDLIPTVNSLDSIDRIIENTKMKTTDTTINRENRLHQLNVQREALITRYINVIAQRRGFMQTLANEMENSCKGARDLGLLIETLYQRLARAKGENLSSEERRIIELDYEITKDIYRRTGDLFGKTFAAESKMLEDIGLLR